MAEPDRELTEGWVKSVVHGEMREALTQHTEMLEKQNKILDKIADGAQAQMLSATILHGSPAIGLKGVLPDLQERVGVIETDVVELRRVGEERFGLMTSQLERLEANQNRIWRGIRRLCEWISTSSDGQVDYKRMIAMATFIGALVHMLLTHWPGWRAVWDLLTRTADKL